MSATHDLHALRASLHARLAELDALDAASAEDRKPVELDQTAVGRVSRMDSLQGQAMAAAAERMRAAERARIRAAFARIDSGEYGWCVKCGAEIAPARLAVDPAVAACIACAER